MRRSLLKKLAVFLLVALAVDWAPGLPPYPEPSSAQAQGVGSAFQIVGPAGTVFYTAASEAYMNRSDAFTTASVTIPGSMFSTSAAANFGQVNNLGSQNASIPLHLIQEGVYSTASSAPVLNVGINFGVGTTSNPKGISPACTPGSGANNCWFATVNLVNAFTPAASLASQPFRLDVWISPIATLTATNATPNITNTVFLKARLQLAQGIPASGGVTNAAQLTADFQSASLAQVNIASAHILNAIWQYGTAAAASSMQIYKTIIKQGD